MSQAVRTLIANVVDRAKLGRWQDFYNLRVMAARLVLGIDPDKINYDSPEFRAGVAYAMEQMLNGYEEEFCKCRHYIPIAELMDRAVIHSMRVGGVQEQIVNSLRPLSHRFGLGPVSMSTPPLTMSYGRGQREPIFRRAREQSEPDSTPAS